MAKSYLNATELSDYSTTLSRRKRSDDLEREISNIYKTKSSERLILGSNPVPIPIVYQDNHSFNFEQPYSARDYVNTSVASYRKARVVGGEDGENGGNLIFVMQFFASFF